MFPVPPIELYNGPSLQGLIFTLTSPGKPNHTLTIKAQVPELFNRAFITGTWNAKTFTGIIIDNNGFFTISIGWAKVSDTPPDHFLLGSLILHPAHDVGKVRVLSYWFLDGVVTVSGDTSGDGPGHVSGVALLVPIP